jgi:prepilin peptidase CpaA
MSAAGFGPLAACLVACVLDLRTRRVPNVLTATTAVAGVLFHLVWGGTGATIASLGGLAVGFALFFPLFALGGMGAGDVKLMAAIGAWIGPTDAAWTALYAAIAGGVMAVSVALARGYLRTALENLWTLAVFWRVSGIRPLDGITLQSSKSPRLPYALPITAGLFATLWLH